MFPKLRFKEFDGDWLKLKYKDVLTIKYGKDHKSLNDGDIPVYGTGGLMRHVNKYLYDGESILIGRKGTIDKPKYINEKFWTVDTLFYTEIEESIVPLFLYQHALEVNWLGLNEATGVPSLNTTSIYNIDISIPSKEEQTKIASFLSAVDEKISQLTKKHELLSQYKQGMMQKLFSQQIRFKADDGSEFGEWEGKELHQIFQIKAGGDIEKSSVSEVRTSEFSYPIFANSDKNKGFYGWANKFKYKEAVTVTGRGNLGIAVARNEPFYPIVRLLVLLPLVKQNLKFFEEQINLLDIVSESTGVPQLTAPQLSKYKVNVPSLEEQTKIANFLSSIDQKIEVVAQQIEQAKQWKKGLLQQMFI